MSGWDYTKLILPKSKRDDKNKGADRLIVTDTT